MSNVGASQLQVLPYTVTFQPGTTPAAPVSNVLALPDTWVETIEILVPNGPGGQMGFALFYAGTQILPWSQTTSWLTVDNWDHAFDIDSEWSTSFTVKGYNQGAWPHSVYLRILGLPISAYQSASATAPVAEIPLTVINVGS